MPLWVAVWLKVCTQVKEMLGSNAVPIVLPIGDEADFKGIIDLAKNRAIVWNEDSFGSTFDVIEIPAVCRSIRRASFGCSISTKTKTHFARNSVKPSGSRSGGINCRVKFIATTEAF